ncbi:MAG: hypothetical protein COY39_04430 [Alphaproteobacteria bacterium CG_4_10_14_0_8_um_filter_37_21]|nr:MAG: hypothetical protein COY39_04430 [Alphaproteobacteria bacterium CG_4_10_14_0_8_um_filter_37_21]
MSKKTFKNKGGFDSLLETNNEESIANKEKIFTKPKLEKVTFRIEEKLMTEIRNMAYWERQNISEILKSSIELKIEKYQKINGPINPRP